MARTRRWSLVSESQLLKAIHDCDMDALQAALQRVSFSEASSLVAYKLVRPGFIHVGETSALSYALSHRPAAFRDALLDRLTEREDDRSALTAWLLEHPVQVFDALKGDGDGAWIRKLLATDDDAIVRDYMRRLLAAGGKALPFHACEMHDLPALKSMLHHAALGDDTGEAHAAFMRQWLLSRNEKGLTPLLLACNGSSCVCNCDGVSEQPEDDDDSSSVDADADADASAETCQLAAYLLRHVATEQLAQRDDRGRSALTLAVLKRRYKFVSALIPVCEAAVDNALLQHRLHEAVFNFAMAAQVPEKRQRLE